MTVYGYARVSTAGQIKGNSFADQEAILKARGCTDIVTEQFTGKTTERPMLKTLVGRLMSGDTLVVTKLDRLARSVTEGSRLIQDLIAKDITIIIDNMGTISNKPMDRLMLNMLLAFAEFERDMIQERTQAGKAVAKTKEGYREGRPKQYSRDQMQHALSLLDSSSYTKVASMTGISKSTLIRARAEQRAKDCRELSEVSKG